MQYRRISPLIRAAALVWIGVGGLACQGDSDEQAGGQATEEALPAVGFVDVTESAGIRFEHRTGAYGAKFFPEMAGAGGGFFDYDGDGWQDILLVNGMDWSTNPDGRSAQDGLALFRNSGDGTFVDVTSEAGLTTELYGMGMAAADFDNDGDVDLLITAVGPNRFYRNNGDGTFSDVSASVGVDDPAWSTSAMFFDYDRDGWLDLYVGNYVVWGTGHDLFCSLDGTVKAYCTPEIYTGQPSRLYHNQGDGTFIDVTELAGVDRPGKALGVALLDFNGDSWPDFVVANDTDPDFLFENNADGTFTERGLVSGMAFDESGKARAGMGIDIGVVDATGKETIFVGNFSNEMIGVYRNLGNGSYVDRAAVSQIGRSSLLYLTFAVFLFDVDLDFDLDLFVANGHVQPEIEEIQQSVTFKQRSLLYINDGDGRFEETGQQAGPFFVERIVGRGAAYADYDRDGDLDILVTTNGGSPHLLKNTLLERTIQQPYVRVTLEGTRSNRDAIGARVTAYLGDRELPQVVRTGSSYLSQSELTLTFGLGTAKQIDSLRVEWPSGDSAVSGAISRGSSVLWREGDQEPIF